MGVWIRSIKYTVPVKRNLFTIWIASRIISQFQSKIKENLFRPSGPFQLCNITPRHHNYVIDWKKVIKTHKTKCLLYPRKVWLSTKPLKIAWSYFSGQKWPILSQKNPKIWNISSISKLYSAIWKMKLTAKWHGTHGMFLLT